MKRLMLLLLLAAVGCTASAPPAEPKPLPGKRIPQESSAAPK